jgi:hypothetical protein
VRACAALGGAVCALHTCGCGVGMDGSCKGGAVGPGGDSQVVVGGHFCDRGGWSST